MPYALIDPNWGHPRPVISTVRDSVDAVWAAAVAPENCDVSGLYSGASQCPFPHGTPGSIGKLKQHGFDVLAVDVIPSQNGA